MRKKWDDILRVRAWNVRRLNVVGKLENLKREMQRLNVHIVVVNEVKWKEDKDFWSDEYRVITTSAENGITGVGFVMNRKVEQRVIYSEQFNDKVILIRISF